MPVLPRAQLRFVLRDLPAHTPPGAEFYLQSNLHGYVPDRPDCRLEPEGGGYTLTLAVPLGTLLEVRVTRGSFETEAGDRYGKRAPMQRLTVTADAELTLEVAGWQDLPQGTRPHTRTGTFETLTLERPEYGDTFEGLVWLPPGYTSSMKRYPVLYLHDGGNVFDAATAYAGVEWEADETAERLALEQGLECILVGIPVRGTHRNVDYTPFASRFNGYSPGASAYSRFLAHTLKPAVDARFRTLPDRGHTGMAGSSFGGLISLYTALEHPELYGFCGALSPSVWLGDFEVRTWLSTRRCTGLRAWVSMGTLEGDSLERAALLLREAAALAEALEAGGTEVRWAVGQGHHHDEAAWAALFPHLLEHFLRGVRPEQD